MRISQVTLYHLRMPLQAHFETSFGRIYARECILLEVHAEGMTGWGECVADRHPGYAYETVGTAWHLYQEFILPALIGKPLVDAADLQARLAHIKGHQMAKAGVEMALWDLLGKASGQSLREMLGGERRRVPVGVSVGLQDTLDELLRVVDGYLARGYRRVKLKIKPGRDLSVVQAVRQRHPDLPLQVDANSAYTLESAAALLPLDDFDLLLIEQPLAEDDLWDHRRLQQRFHTPLCLDESITGPRQARQALEMEACRVINIKQGRVGGLLNARRIHDLCLRQDVPVWCGGMLETGVGRAANLALASLPDFKLPGDISATERYYARDITREVFTLNADSTIDVPDAPGLGVTVDREALEQATVRKAVFPPR